MPLYCRKCGLSISMSHLVTIFIVIYRLPPPKTHEHVNPVNAAGMLLHQSYVISPNYEHSSVRVNIYNGVDRTMIDQREADGDV